MATAKQPATALPWRTAGTYGQNIAQDDCAPQLVMRGGNSRRNKDDAAYIAHACNSYPKLIEALRSALSAAKGDWQKGASWDHAATKLLGELGEL